MAVVDIIKEKIKTQGAIPFDEYMDMVLYFPEEGYYMRKDIKFGRNGDFFTSSHLGSTFGFLLSMYIKKFWQKTQYKDFTITEIGPGDGFLAQDILENLDFPIRYFLIEKNQYLVQTQADKLRNHRDKTYWYNSLDNTPPFCGVVVCNEVFDALPVRVFEIAEGELKEVYITLNKDEEFTEILMKPRQDTVEFLQEFAPWVFNFKRFRSEINLEAKNLIFQISQVLTKGILLVFDYGYTSDELYDESRNRGSLLCYYKHSINENPYINIGKQDITAHVNFSSLMKWAQQVGFTIEEFSSQTKFLVSLCDEEVLRKLQQKNLIQQLKRLILPQGMGQTHKVMVLYKS